MTAFIARRLLWFGPTMWVVFTVTFVLMRSVPGGPFSRERALPPQIEQKLSERFHLDRSFGEQYLIELGNIARGDLGYSMRMGDFRVAEVILAGFPVSAALGILAMLFALLLGLTTGIVAAVRRQTALDFGLRTLAAVGIAAPEFVIAGVAIILFAFVWPLFPPAGWGDAEHLILPALCLGAPYAAYIARLTRTGMLDVLHQDYIRTAHAKGLAPRTVILRHAIKGAMLPVVSFLGPAISGIITGSLVIERIFAIPGMGMHFIEAATQKDYTLAMGFVLFDTTLLYLLNMFVDVAYRFLDPRISWK